MSRYYAYDYPGDNGTNHQVISSTRRIIKRQIQFAEEFHGYHYRSADDALCEYLIVHWAYSCNKAGEPVKDKHSPYNR